MTAESDLSLVFSTDRPPDGDIVFRGRFKIDPETPFPEFDLMGATAYSVTDIKNPTRQLFVRLCEIGVIPRVETMVQLKPLEDISIMKPLDWGPVYWPPESQRRFAVFFDQPENGPLMKSLADRIDPMKLDFIVNTLFRSAATTFEIFERRNQIHRSIRPDNLYVSGLEGAWVQFGDCVTVPPGWGQSPILETIEMGMTPMSSRGPGSLADDMYSLGASVMFLAIGHCPVIDMPINDLIAKKIEFGSFAALLGDERPPLGLREPLRGLLCDDPLERWGLEDIEEFINGEPGRTVSIGRQSRAARGFEFNGDSIRHSRLLASAFGDDSTAATTAMNSSEFPKWVNRYLDENSDGETMSEIISELLENTHDKQDKFLATRICQILDPLGPMRFQGLIMFPDGLGSMLAEAMRTNNSKDMNLIADCINAGVPLDWMENRENKLLLDQSVAKKNIKRVQQLLKISQPGYGIERCLYDLNPFAPCMSEMLEKAYVYSLHDLLPALEEIVIQKGGLPMLMDRHVVAFISARESGQLDRKLKPLEDEGGKAITAKIAMLYLLAYVQRMHGPDTLPYLTKWLAGELKPALELYNSRTLREDLSQNLENVVAKGRIDRLYAHLHNAKTLKIDKAQYKSAQSELIHTTARIEEMESPRYLFRAKRSGWRLASNISTCIALTTIFFMIFA